MTDSSDATETNMVAKLLLALAILNLIFLFALLALNVFGVALL